MMSASTVARGTQLGQGVVRRLAQGLVLVRQQGHQTGADLGIADAAEGLYGRSSDVGAVLLQHAEKGGQCPARLESAQDAHREQAEPLLGVAEHWQQRQDGPAVHETLDGREGQITLLVARAAYDTQQGDERASVAAGGQGPDHVCAGQSAAIELRDQHRGGAFVADVAQNAHNEGCAVQADLWRLQLSNQRLHHELSGTH